MRMTRADLDSAHTFKKSLTQYIQCATDLGMTHYYPYFGDIMMWQNRRLFVLRTEPSNNGQMYSLLPEDCESEFPANYIVQNLVEGNPLKSPCRQAEYLRREGYETSEQVWVENFEKIKRLLGMAQREELPPELPSFTLKVGSLGQILEWRREYEEAAVGQKHLSPLVLLNRRVSAGSGSTGLSRTWLINSFARVFDGDSAWDPLMKWFQKFPTPYNLYNTDAGSPKYVFQIDRNFGFVSGVTEMLLQSHADVAHLLPALPSAVPTGSVEGLVARGNFVVDVAWDQGALTSANITCKAGAELAIRYMNGSQIAVDGEAYTGPLGTTTGTTYVVTPS
ncbi:hypothetical protein INS49_015172 [Diaporthe citri]|uniref:uncharacterized protein n=1 Tax=Diaporthe citri TaxID=83186 RepID=UPI001C7FE64E|nr:uncharacterized protein INS49_015172 [Diaporthe citri]KAG6357294.1 hypothetical protein INS49_015172 [Diaporthe citri]